VSLKNGQSGPYNVLNGMLKVETHYTITSHELNKAPLRTLLFSSMVYSSLGSVLGSLVDAYLGKPAYAVKQLD
jgi:hypothetical protein